MYLIVAVSKDWGIGLDNKLLFNIPEDMKFFRTTTAGNIVIMGRKTLESFPGGRPLKNRINIVITRDTEYKAEGAIVVHSVEEAIDAANAARVDKDIKAKLNMPEDAKLNENPEIFVIGGDSIYRQMLPYVDTAYVTRVDASVPCDTYFPNLETNGSWEEKHIIASGSHEGLDYKFVVYTKVFQEELS